MVSRMCLMILLDHNIQCYGTVNLYIEIYMHRTYVDMVSRSDFVINIFSAQCGATCPVEMVSIRPRLIEEAVIEASVELSIITLDISVGIRIFLESRSCRIM